jgi:hypothetical protein
VYSKEYIFLALLLLHSFVAMEGKDRIVLDLDTKVKVIEASEKRSLW